MKVRARITSIGLIVSTVVAIAFAIAIASSPSKAASADDVELVHETVFNYFNGASGADLSLMEKAWDKPNAHMKFVEKNDQGVDEVQVLPIAEMFKSWAKAAAPAKGTLLSMDIVDGKMAVVKFEFITKGKTYIDYLSLYKINGQWKIVNKIFIIR